MSPRLRRVAGLSIAVALAVAVAACGVSAEGTPQAVNPDDVPFSLLDPNISTPPTEPPAAGKEPFSFFLIRSGESGTFLESVTREVPEDPTVNEVVSALLALQPDPAEAGLITRIPEGTTLLGSELDVDTRVLTLDFSENLLTVVADGQTGLFAQIVFTATEIDTVDRVLFKIDGVATPALDGAFAPRSDPVGRSDYQDFRPPIVSTTTTR